MAKNGYAGLILHVDLTSRRWETRPTSDFAALFPGGRALALKLYWDEVPVSAAAGDPANRLIIALGPMAGVDACHGTEGDDETVCRITRRG